LLEKISFPPNEFWDWPAFRDCGKLSLASQAALKKRGYTGSF